MRPLTDPEMRALINLRNQVMSSGKNPRDLAMQLREEGNTLFGVIATLFGADRAVDFARTIADSIENNKKKYTALTAGYYMQQEVLEDIASLPTYQEPPKVTERGPYL